MGAIVSFDYDVWVARYPEFISVPKALAQAYFSEATLYQANDGTGPICDPGQQLATLNMLTAHIAQLNAPLNGQASPQIVGRISSATEGSVSVQTQMDYPPGTAQWANQSKYGAAWWTATRQYRTFQYIPNCGGPFGVSNGFGYGWR